MFMWIEGSNPVGHIQETIVATRLYLSPLWVGLLFWGVSFGATAFSAQELLLAMLKGSYEILGIEFGSATCEANALPAIILFQLSGFLLKK